jgi:hypothetical protein
MLLSGSKNSPRLALSMELFCRTLIDQNGIGLRTRWDSTRPQRYLACYRWASPHLPGSTENTIDKLARMNLFRLPDDCQAIASMPARYGGNLA